MNMKTGNLMTKTITKVYDLKMIFFLQFLFTNSLLTARVVNRKSLETKCKRVKKNHHIDNKTTF